MHTDIPYVIDVKNEKVADILSWIDKGLVDLQELANRLQKIPVVGGDGTMLTAIQKYGHLNIPFFGIDRGTEGFLLNPIKKPSDLNFSKDLKVISLRMMKVRFFTRDGEVVKALAFNDVFFNVAPGTVCHGKISGSEYPEKKIRGDGIIVATSQGSTAYTKEVDGAILPLREDLWAISSISGRSNLIREAIDAQEIVIEFNRGKMTAHADRQKVEDVVKATISQTDKVIRLAFLADYNFTLKRYL